MRKLTTLQRQTFPYELEFISSSIGQQHAAEDAGIQVLLDRNHHLLETLAVPLIAALNDQFHPNAEPLERISRAGRALLITYRDKHDISINRAIQRLVDQRVFKETDGLDDMTMTKHLVFVFVGISTCLYVPSSVQDNEVFNIDPQGPKALSRSVPLKLSARPPDELFRAIGEVLPGMNDPALEADNTSNVTRNIHVSKINASVLKTLAGIDIIWVETIGSHLVLDPVAKALYLFKIPSFCELNRTANSILSVVTKELYGERHCAISDLMQEIMLSYQIIFKDDRRARINYKDTRPAGSLGSGCDIDPLLNELCGLHMSTSRFAINNPIRETYSTETDFPILGNRLWRIQSFVSGIEPNRLRSIWRDRRDLKLWYTLWAVLIIGVINIIQATMSLIFSGAQTALAVEANRLAKQQLLQGDS